jgi:integrase
MSQTQPSRNLTERWLEDKGLRVKPTTLEDYRRQLDKHILPVLGDRKARSVTTYELQKLLDGLLSPRITNKCRVVLGAMFKVGVGWGIVEMDPTRPLTGLKESRRDPRFLTHEEARSLLNQLAGQYQLIAFVGLTAGMRIGEILAPRMDKGQWIEATIAEFTGGTPDKPTIGCNIHITYEHIEGL